MEVGQVAKAYGQGDFQDGGVALLEELYGFLQAEVVDVFNAGHAGVLLEEAHEMIFAEAADIGQLADGDGGVVVGFNVV